MNCDEFVELVTEFLDGALDERTEARVLDHLTGCDGCERYLGQFQRTIRELGSLPEDDLPSGERLPAEAREALLAAFRNRKK